MASDLASVRGPDRLDHVVARAEGRRHRGAALGLGAEDLAAGLGHQAQLRQLAERLVDLDQLGAGRHRHDDLLGQPPAQLLGDLEADRLGALGVVRADVHVHERPVLALVGQLGGQLVDVVVAALDGDQGAAVDRRAEDLLRLQVGRDQDHRADPGPGRGRGHRVGQVAGRGAGQDLEAELQGGGQRDGHDPVLERVGRVGPLVLDPQRAHARARGPAGRPGPAGSSPARCWARRRRPAARAAGWRSARCCAARPRCPRGSAGAGRRRPPAGRSTRRRRGWRPAHRSGRTRGRTGGWRCRSGTYRTWTWMLLTADAVMYARPLSSSAPTAVSRGPELAPVARRPRR